MQKTNQKDSFYHLDPNQVLEATQNAGFHPTGQFTQLNSYENRVFDIKLEDKDLNQVIAKFYRPGRWSQACVQEEHDFLFELKNEGLTVAAPFILQNKKSTFMHDQLIVTFFPKVLGRMSQEFSLQDLKHIGKKIALLHNVGARKEFKHRPTLGEHPFDPWENLELILKTMWPDMRSRYQKAAELIFDFAQSEIDIHSFQRIHGDCHRGNILHNGQSGNDSEFFFVDFDDCMTGPIIQDFWMLFSSEHNQEEEDALIKSYEELREFPYQQLTWIPALRGLRIVNYAAWIARRWTDPSFPKLFPDFHTFQYWAEEVEALEKIAWSVK